MDLLVQLVRLTISIIHGSCLLYSYIYVGVAMVTTDKALLWTDGRYHLQASKQLDCNWTLMKQGLPGVPSIIEWIEKVKNLIFSFSLSLSLSLGIFIVKELNALVSRDNKSFNCIRFHKIQYKFSTVVSLYSGHPWDKCKCPDYRGVLISGVKLYYKAQFGTFVSVLNMGVSSFQGVLNAEVSLVNTSNIII